MQQHSSDNQAGDAQSTSSVGAQQMQRQQLQVISPPRATLDLSGAARQGILYQEAMQSLQSPQSFPPLGPAANAMNAPQQVPDWNGDGRFVQQPLRYPPTLQPVYDFRGQLLTPGNLTLHPANVNQLVQYTYGSPQQRPSQGPATQFAPWQTIFTPNPGLAWVPGGIQATSIDGQGNQILNRNLHHDSQPGVFIQNGQPHLQQFKQADGQHAPIPKTAINDNFPPTLPNLVTTVNNLRTQQQAQIQALQTMLQSQKVLTKNSIRLTSATTPHKNGGYHANTTASLAHPVPLVLGAIPGQITRPAPSSSAQESKRMKQAQVPEESPRKELVPLQQPQKRYQHIQGSPGSASNGIPGTPEGVTLPVLQTTPVMRTVFPESVASANSTIQILPQTPLPQGALANSEAVLATNEHQLEMQGDAEEKKRTQVPASPVAGHSRVEEPPEALGESGKCVKEKPNSKQKTSPEAGDVYCEDTDGNARSEKDDSGTTTSKATVLVKPQMMAHTTEGSFEPKPSPGDCEDGQAKSEVDGKIFEGDDKELTTKAIADSEKEGFLPSNKQTKPNLSKWTVADVYEFVRTVPGCSEYAEDFVTHDIDGEALMLLKTDHLVSAMSMTLGPAMKIISRIDAMRRDAGGSAK